MKKYSIDISFEIKQHDVGLLLLDVQNIAMNIDTYGEIRHVNIHKPWDDRPSMVGDTNVPGTPEVVD